MRENMGVRQVSISLLGSCHLAARVHNLSAERPSDNVDLTVLRLSQAELYREAPIAMCARKVYHHSLILDNSHSH